MRNLLIVSAAAVALLGHSVDAADLRMPPPVYAPPPVIVPLLTWTGCYIGGNAGFIWAKNDWNDTVFGEFGSNTKSGGLGGAQFGCNYQVAGWVFGIQGDWDGTSINGDNPNLVFSAPTVFSVTGQTKISTLASITGRVGYGWGRFLGYVKGGGAWEKSNVAFQVAGSSVATVSTTQNGWTAGIGGEYAFLNWLTGFIEYDYYGFGSSSPGVFVCAPAVCGGIMSFKTSANVLKVGVNVKFGPGGL